MLANIRVDLRKDRQTDTECFFFPLALCFHTTLGTVFICVHLPVLGVGMYFMFRKR